MKINLFDTITLETLKATLMNKDINTLSRSECNDTIKSIQQIGGESIIEGILKIKTIGIASWHSGQKANQKLIALKELLTQIQNAISTQQVNDVPALRQQTSNGQNGSPSITNIQINNDRLELKKSQHAELLFENYEKRLKSGKYLDGYDDSPLVYPERFTTARLLVMTNINNITSTQEELIKATNSNISKEYINKLVKPYNLMASGNQNIMRRSDALQFYARDLFFRYHGYEDKDKDQDFSNLFQFLSYNAGTNVTNESIAIFKTLIVKVIPYCAAHTKCSKNPVYSALEFLKHLTVLMITGQFSSEALFLHYMHIITHCGMIDINVGTV